MTEEFDPEEEYVSHCPVCGEPIDYCQGHGEIGDPMGHLLMTLHEEGNHKHCHPEAECRADQDD